MKGVSIPYTEEMEKFLKCNVKGTHFKDLTDMFNRQFNVCYKIVNIAAKCKRMGCNNGIDCRIKKGNIPFNKGKKMPEEIYKRCAGTMFKKGNTPHNHRPVGSERLQAEGYWYVKVGEPNKWKLKHHIEWEKYNKPIDTKKEVIIFLDGNRANCNISNLKKIPRSYDACMSFLGLWSKNKDINNTSLNVVKLFKETKRARNESNRKRT